MSLDTWRAMIPHRYRLTGAGIADRSTLVRTSVAGQPAAAGLGQLQALEPQPPVVR